MPKRSKVSDAGRSSSNYCGMIGFGLVAINYSVGRYAMGKAHIEGIEPFLATQKRGYHGTSDHFRAEYIQCDIIEFAARQKFPGGHCLTSTAAA